MTTPDTSKIAAWSAIAVSTLVALSSALLPAIHAVLDKGPTGVPLAVQVTAGLATLTALFAYVYDHGERTSTQIAEIGARPASGTVVFDSTATFLKALAEATDGAQEVCTINSAVPRGVIPSLDDYFERIGKYLASSRSRDCSFRSLAYVETPEKAAWLVTRVEESRAVPATSFRVVSQRSLGESASLCFHLVKKDGFFRVFLYPSPDATGSMHGVSIAGLEAYQVLHGLFERMWVAAVPLASGRQIHREGIEFLATLSPDLMNTPQFKRALLAASS